MNIRDRISEILWSNIYNSKGTVIGIEDAADTIASVLPKMIVPLVWDTTCAQVFPNGAGVIHCKAQAQFGFNYCISSSAEDGIVVSFSYGGFDVSAETVEGAHAKADAHYCKQVLAPFRGEDK